MEKDKQWIKFFEDNVRYSDVINGLGCKGEQIVNPSDLMELDTKINGKYRDILRKVEDYRVKGGIDVCKAINDLIIDSKKEGREVGVLETQKNIISNMLKQNVPTETICLFTGCNVEFVNEVKSGVVA